jgi:hypothetical protein
MARVLVNGFGGFIKETLESSVLPSFFRVKIQLEVSNLHLEDAPH